MDIPVGLDHIKMVGLNIENNKIETSKFLQKNKDNLVILGNSLSVMYQVSTCHRKCFGDPHVLERLVGRGYNLAISSYTLITRGLYDEALNLVRSMGEISNLILLSVVDKDSLQGWLKADKKTRIRNYSPAKIRILIEKSNSPFLMYATKEWYSKLCEEYTHITPDTRPNAHSESGQHYVGVSVQEAGLHYALDELAMVSVYIALLSAKYTGMEDMITLISESQGSV
jgi:hypothetical protein